MAHSREKKLIEVLQGDLRSLSNETKKKYPPVKEASESAIMKIRTMSATCGETLGQASYLQSLQKSCADLLQPFLMGCDTKSLTIIQLCLTSIQRLINYEIIDPSLARNVANVLWQVYDQGIEELQLRLLQTTLVLLTSKRSAVAGDILSRALVLCFRLHFTKNEVTNHTAEATIRQVVAVVFDRLLAEDKLRNIEDCNGEPYIPKNSEKYSPPPNTTSAVRDAYMLLQDLCQLVNAESPYWLIGITEMTRTFGLELLEAVLKNYQPIFNKHAEFKFLLKDRVCALVIKLFSPNIKHRQGAPSPPSSTQVQEKPFFPISMRLLRVVSILLKNYLYCLVTESEIFISLLLKFLDSDKPFWQRALAIEVLQQICIEPELLRSFCCVYDMKIHNNKIFRNLVSSLGSFIQNIMAAHSLNTFPTSGDVINGASTFPTAPLIVAPLNLYYKGVSIPLLPIGSIKNSKNLYREMLDKVEPPPVPDGYVLGLAFYAYLDLVEGLASIINSNVLNPELTTPNRTQDVENSEELINVCKEMLETVWCEMLSVLSLLLDSCTDESTAGSVLKCIELCAALCGHLVNVPARDAFITMLCKACLPAHYALPIFNASLAYLPQKIMIGSEQQEVLNSSLQQQVVVMGQSLVTNSSQISVMLTAKNIQCMQGVLNLALCHGSILNTSWQILLTTLQHLVWILGLKPTSGGQMAPNPRSSSEPNTGNNTVLTTAVLTDLPILSSKLSKVFEASKDLDDVALHHLINALCSLSLEAMDAAYNNNIKEPSLFAVAKLLETGLVNMCRIEILWRPVSGHLLEVCQHPNSILREWGAEGVTSLVKSAIGFKHDVSLSENPRMLHMFLHPLKQLSTVSHTDVKQKQLDSTLQILHSSGDILSSGWPDLLYIVESATETSSENLIRTGFRSLQLIVSDFLPSMPCQYLKCCINVVTKFGLQTQDFNISLTAIGLLWSVSDFMFQNSERISENLSKEENSTESPTMEELWLDLFVKISELCMDGRPAVRKSAGQTMFSTISTHGSILVPAAWDKAIWDVLFVLMDNVQNACDSASQERSNNDILMHHSRDTAQKQWQETLVLTLAGLSRIFKLKQNILTDLPRFSKAWEKLFAYLEKAALCNSSEVSGAAMCSFEDVLLSDLSKGLESENTQLWVQAWETWCRIGVSVTKSPSSDVEDLDNVISQSYLTSYVSLFCTLYKHIQSKFSLQNFQDLENVLVGAVTIPVRWDSAAFELPVLSGFHLTPLQDEVIRSINLVQKNISSESDDEMYPAIFRYLLKNVEYASKPPRYGKLSDKILQNGKHKWLCPNCTPFAEYSMGLAVELYKKTACHKSVIQHDVLTLILSALHIPLSKRHNAKTKSTWLLAVDSLMHVMQTGMPVVRQYSQSSYFDKLWDVLYQCIENFLFPVSQTPADLSVEEQATQEKLDVKLVQLLKNEVLPHNSSIPSKFISNIIEMLNKGSSHIVTMNNTDIHVHGARELFRQACFDTLLQFSIITKKSNSKSNDSHNSHSTELTDLSLESLIKQCHTSLLSYLEQDRLTLRYPIPQEQVNDTMRLLQFMDTLLKSLIENPKSADQSFWKQFLDLYPVLVNCISCSSPEFRTWIAKLLLHYNTFIKIEHLCV
ncbi:protein MON2 homolog [Styela clava]